MAEVREYTKDEIKEKILVDNRWLIRGAQAIWDRQTVQEKASEVTIDSNGVGFNGVDAGFCTSLLLQYQTRGSLSDRQWECLRKCMVKYSGQLAQIANSKAV